MISKKIQTVLCFKTTDNLFIYTAMSDFFPNARFAFTYFNIESSLEEIKSSNKPKIIPIGYD